MRSCRRLRGGIPPLYTGPSESTVIGPSVQQGWGAGDSVNILIERKSHAAKPLLSLLGLSLLIVHGLWACSKNEPYHPPDPFYYFASYKVGKNPTTITTEDLNHDSFTDLVTTNIASNTLSILLGNGDGTF